MLDGGVHFIAGLRMVIFTTASFSISPPVVECYIALHLCASLPLTCFSWQLSHSHAALKWL